MGIVALVGTAEGGAPLTVDESLADATNPNTVQERYRSGDLRTAGIFCFEPSQDDAIPGGAQKEILVKVNPATASGVSLPDINGADSIDVTSVDFGLFTAQINVEVSAGTNQGLKYVVVFENTVETFDDVGGEAIFDVTYTPGSDGYDTALGVLSASAFTVAATKTEAGLDSERAADIPAAGVLDVVSDNVGDTTQTLTVYGLDGGGALISEAIALNGTTNVTGAIVFTKVLACRLDAAAAGTITVSDSPITTTIFTILTAILTRGIVDVTNGAAAGVITMGASADIAADVAVLGTSASGAAVNDVFDLTTALTTPVVGTTVFGTITTLLLGDLPVANSAIVNVDAVITDHSQFTTVALVVDRLNAIAGFAATSIVSNFTTFLMTDADYNTLSPTNVLSVAGEFFADLFEGAKVLTQNSQFVNGARATGGTLPPVATAAPVFLVGGTEGVTTITEWQTAFKLLEKRRYNILVPLSPDPAIHNLALSALIAKTGRLKSEANGYVGIGLTDGSGAGQTRAEIQSQIQTLNTRHISAISQELNRFDPLTGVATFFPPFMFAAVAAGMQAGSAIAEPLTRKLVIGNAIRNDPSWTVEDDASDLIDRGLMIFEQVDEVGIRCVRSITTHLADDNLAFVEMSSNESLNTFVFEFRTALDQKIGQRGLGNSTGAIKALAIEVANRIVSEDKIVAHRSLQVDQVGDVFPVSIEVALVNPINFIPITVHLTPTTVAAAA